MKYLILIVYWLVFWGVVLSLLEAVSKEKHILVIIIGVIITIIVICYKYVEL